MQHTILAYGEFIKGIGFGNNRSFCEVRKFSEREDVSAFATVHRWVFFSTYSQLEAALTVDFGAESGAARAKCHDFGAGASTMSPGASTMSPGASTMSPGASTLSGGS